MCHHELFAVAMRARVSANDDAQIEQFQRVGCKESGELHVGILSDVATPLLCCCHKLPVSIRRSYQCSTAQTQVEKALFNPDLNNRKRDVEHLRLD
jgi:hypothetical protein